MWTTLVFVTRISVSSREILWSAIIGLYTSVSLVTHAWRKLFQDEYFVFN